MRCALTFLILVFSFGSFSQNVQLGLPIGHNSSVSSAQYSADGKTVLSCSYDRQIFLWDVETGKIKKRFFTEGMVNSAYFCDNESKILINFTDKAQVIDIATSKIVQYFKGPGLPDKKGTKLIVFSELHDGFIRTWDFKTNKFVGKVKAPGKRYEANYSEALEQVAFNTYEIKALIDVKSNKVIRKFNEVKEIFSVMKVSDDGNWLTFEHEGIIEVYNAKDADYYYQIATTDGWGPNITFDDNNHMFLFYRSGEIYRHDLHAKTGDEIGFMNTAEAGIVTDAKLVKNTNLFTLATPTRFCSIDVSQNPVVINWHPIPDFFALTGVKYVTNHPFKNESLIFGEDYNDIVIFNPETNTIEKKLTNYSRQMVTANFNSDGSKILLNSLGSAVCFDVTAGDTKWLSHPPTGGETVFDLQIGRDTTTIIPFEKMFATIVLSNDKKHFVTVNQARELEVRSSETLKVTQSFKPEFDQFQLIKFSENDSLLFTSESDTILKCWRVETGELVSTMIHFDDISDITICPMNDFILTIAGEYENSTAFIWYVPKGELSDYFQMETGVNAINFYDGIQYVYTSDGGENVDVYSIAHELVNKIKLDEGFSPPLFEDFMTGQLFQSYQDEDFKKYGIYLLDPLTNERKEIIKLDGYLMDMKQSPGGKYLAISQFDNQLALIDLMAEPAQVIWKKATHLDQIMSINFSSDAKTMITTSVDGSIILYETETGIPILQRYQFDVNNNKWVHIHASGFFDASSEAMELMYWTKDMEVIEFAQLKDRYWVPGLWEKVMKGEALPEVGNINDIKLQPEINFGNVTNDQLPILLTKRDGGYGKVSIFINGKEVISDARGDDMDTTLAEQTLYFDIKNHPYLVDGENEIIVKASSADGFVQGRGEMFKIQAQKVDAEKPSFFGVVIGVGDYVNDKIDLKFPVKDAEAVSVGMKLGAENLFGADKTFMYSVTSGGTDRPTKTNISAVFDEIATKAQAQDVIMIYLSGHGVTWGGDQGDFYFLTADATAANKEAYNDPIIRQNNAISTAEWVELLKKIPATKQVMIIDACGSGKAVDNLIAARDIETSQIKAIDRMKDRTGMYIISGCTTDAVSYEASQYGQGLLTYSILEAMKGAAIRSDGSVDLALLMQYSRDRVPVLAAGLGGIQEPQILSPKGGSIDIGILSDVDRAAIPLAAPKIVFVRSAFLDTDSFSDDLNLSKAIDDLLGDVSARGEVSKFVFFDAREFPDAFKLSGGYTQSKGLITLKLKIKGPVESEHLLKGKNLKEITTQISGIIKSLE